jgi:hypothetical protein
VGVGGTPASGCCPAWRRWSSPKRKK